MLAQLASMSAHSALTTRRTVGVALTISETTGCATALARCHRAPRGTRHRVRVLGRSPLGARWCDSFGTRGATYILPRRWPASRPTTACARRRPQRRRRCSCRHGAPVISHCLGHRARVDRLVATAQLAYACMRRGLASRLVQSGGGRDGAGRRQTCARCDADPDTRACLVSRECGSHLLAASPRAHCRDGCGREDGWRRPR